MITKSIADLKERGGPSLQAILKYIMVNFQVGNNFKVVNMHLKLKSTCSQLFRNLEVSEIISKTIKRDTKSPLGRQLEDLNLVGDSSGKKDGTGN
ncbi:hypothetical protein QYM36_014765 [Artemia franciscana]|uniref:H15 domain-containing protein n=1 Tax=Artemia franciscana TaxID=6661 RepID=A0AA88HL28_ARTSF|nr:hypothetical protein QYM36_014765 [Artemia franciscana]